MSNRFAVALALAIVGGAVTAGGVSAQSPTVLESATSVVVVDIPTGGELPSLDGVLPACMNLEDDDDDGHVDLEDADCTGPLDDSETEESDTPEEGEDTPPVDPAPEPEPQQQTEDPASHQIEPGGELNTGKDSNGKGKSGKKDGKGNKGSKGKGNQSPKKKGKGTKGKGENKRAGTGGTKPPDRKPDGSPTRSNPTLSISELGAAPIGVPNFTIDQFQIPPFLLPIYQACGTQHGIPWQVLASINRIETAFGTNLNVSSAGAVGWMQFLPSTWKGYGVDANRDGRKDPYNPVDAICAAAKYLAASGGSDDLRRAIFAYNHADWYVDEVLLYARQYGELPSSLISSLTGLTEGAHFPVAARARYADDISERRALRRATPRMGVTGNVADVISSSPTRRGINIFAKKRSPVIAVNDGIIRRVGSSPELGNFVVLEDAFGNRYTYARLGKVAKAHPVPKRGKLRDADFEIVRVGKNWAGRAGSVTGGQGASRDSAADSSSKPERAKADTARRSEQKGFATVKGKNAGVLKFDPKSMTKRTLRKGSKILGGTRLGRLGKGQNNAAPHVHFAIRPAGRGAKKIDPKPILDGWKLLEATAIYRAKGKNPFARRASVGQDQPSPAAFEAALPFDLESAAPETQP